MRHFKDIFFDKMLSFRINNPYPVALDIMEIVSHFGYVKEKENIFTTDGPRKIARLIFDLEEKIDKNSKTVLSFDIDGEANEIGMLNLKITGFIQADMESSQNIVSESFQDFYTTDILSDARKKAEDRMQQILETIRAKIKV